MFPGQGAKSETPGKVDLPVGAESYPLFLVLGMGIPSGRISSLKTKPSNSRTLDGTSWYQPVLSTAAQIPLLR